MHVVHVVQTAKIMFVYLMEYVQSALTVNTETTVITPVTGVV